ncbi:pirin family protein [Alkalilimnicola sp. S0819]|uniref:pirin family protein n=1 Tax=Alkalilimnicola sp. S0819 TaxID=2613922 RepID=UPI0012625DB4|nr:pirin family protein [Alkalilimnicola sp. S0819]KAB7627371.1 pirin family protein [Alkalilimnicola sp. S0819]MPQ16089.1 quercetin 2,3-dioxygenase [Alkalilimnicola sp. S0819]
MKTREVRHILNGQPASDGAGVKLLRILNPQQPLDPFLMLDEFNSERADDYIAGFPAHPHRGFETVTYMLEGRMLHEDHLGNQGLLESGGVQWMTAGRGIIHSEMPQQEAGRMHGFQLWINLPAAEKMKPASYRDITPGEIPVVDLPGARVKLIAGELAHAGGTTQGAVHGIATEPMVLDAALTAGAELSLPIPTTHTALAYVFEGELVFGGRGIRRGQMVVLGDGDSIDMSAADQGGRVLVLAAKPLGEPIRQYGPFVMNTVEELEQALQDYRDGRLTG